MFRTQLHICVVKMIVLTEKGAVILIQFLTIHSYAGTLHI